LQSLDFVVFKLQQVGVVVVGVFLVLFWQKTPLKAEPKSSPDLKVCCVKQRKKKTAKQEAFTFVTRGALPPLFGLFFSFSFVAFKG
jgi:hypothetical protein